MQSSEILHLTLTNFKLKKNEGVVQSLETGYKVPVCIEWLSKGNCHSAKFER